MKTIKIQISLLVVILIVTGCQKADILTPQNDKINGTMAQNTIQSNNYSKYILSLEEVENMVIDILKHSKNNDFTNKEIDGIEPILIEDITTGNNLQDEEYLLIDTLLQTGFIKATDPAFFKVSFKDGGFAIVFPDKDIGPSVVYMQSQELNFIFDSLPDDMNGDGFVDINPFPWVSQKEFDRDRWIRWFFKHINNDPFVKHRPPFGREQDPYNGIHITHGKWKTISLIENDKVKDFLPATHQIDSYKAYYTMSDIPSVVLSFLGYWENVTYLFEKEGNWNIIKNNILDSTLHYWAYMIDQYCKIRIGYYELNDASKIAKLLKDECGNAYPNAHNEQLVYNYDLYNHPTPILSEEKPITILLDNGTPYILRKEHISYRECYVNGVFLRNEYEIKLEYIRENIEHRIVFKGILEKDDNYYVIKY